MTTWTRFRTNLLVPVLLLALGTSGCAEVGRLYTGPQPTPGPDPVAVLPPTTGQPTTSPSTGAAPTGEPTGAVPTGEPTGAAPTGQPTGAAPTGEPTADRAAGGLVPSEPGITDAQARGAVARATAPVVVAVDAAVAMGEGFGATTRIDATRAAVERLVVGTPAFVDLGIVRLGGAGDGTAGGRSESCSTVSTLAFPGDAAPGDADGLDAVGWRPVATMLDLVIPVLAEVGQQVPPLATTTPGRVVLLTSGADSCDRDPVGLVTTLDRPPVIDVIALMPSVGDADALRRLADAAGGTYQEVGDPASLLAAVDALVERPARELDRAISAPPPSLRAVLAELAQQVQQAAGRREVDDAADPAR